MLLQKRPDYLPKPRGTCSDPAGWQPVPLAVRAPGRGVTVGEGGLFHAAMRENIEYLLRSFSVDHMLYPFRARAGAQNPPGRETQVPFWDTRLEGSNAGRFLMGAGNTLRWLEHAELRRRLDAVVEGIAACQRPDGYLHAFAPEYMIAGDPGTRWGEAQRSNYARCWVTYGLLDAALAGNAQALPLIRAGHDWFNRCPYLADLPKAQIWMQGHLASTRMYFSDLGKPEDLQIAERFYVVDSWLDKLLAHDLEAIWIDGLANPHCYEIIACEAYLDHFLATGDRRYLDGMDAAWQMIRDHWLHAGGSVALCEGEEHPPGSRFIDPIKHTGELCGSVFWARFNQRFHRLRPDDERYVGEIERSIYNVALANQQPGLGIRYHARLEGHKERATQINTCCEGQGTGFYGSLPEYIYSLTADGVYVNLFEPSTLDAALDGRHLRLRMETRFPYDALVRLTVESSPGRCILRVRIPGWAIGPMTIAVNCQTAATGMPGTYVALDREWTAGDTVDFELPIGVRLLRYHGVDCPRWHARYAILYGPLLLSVVGPPGDLDPHLIELARDPEDFPAWLIPVADQPLRWRIADCPEHVIMPYLEVDRAQHFTCYPVLRGRR